MFTYIYKNINVINKQYDLLISVKYNKLHNKRCKIKFCKLHSKVENKGVMKNFINKCYGKKLHLVEISEK